MGVGFGFGALEVDLRPTGDNIHEDGEVRLAWLGWIRFG